MPEPDDEAIGVVAEVAEDVPARERVLPAADGDEHTLASLDHGELVDRLRHLVAAHAQEVLRAVVGVLAANVDDRGTAADAALHANPPEITGRISTVSSPASIASPGTSVSPWMTSTDSRFRSRRFNNAITEMGARHVELAARVAQAPPSRTTG